MADLTSDDQIENITHEQFKSCMKKVISSLIRDRYLSDVPSEPTNSLVQALINLETGKAIVVNLREVHEPNAVSRIIVCKNATVRQLKKEISRVQTKNKKLPAINWTHIWKMYELVCNGEVMHDNDPVSQYSALSKEPVTFARRKRD